MVPCLQAYLDYAAGRGCPLLATSGIKDPLGADLFCAHFGFKTAATDLVKTAWGNIVWEDANDTRTKEQKVQYLLVIL